MTLLETERLCLRRLVKNDAAALSHIFGDAQVMRFGDGVQTEAWIGGWLARVVQDYEEKGYGPLAVVAKQNGLLIGYCGLFDFADINGRPEIELGYRLIKQAWGKGYTTEAGTAVRDYAFTDLGIKRLVSLIDPGNSASIAVARKLGMVYEADVLLEGYTHPDHLYVINKVPGKHQL